MPLRQHNKGQFQDILTKMSKISEQFLISGQFQDICEISGISGQLGALLWLPLRRNKDIHN